MQTESWYLREAVCGSAWTTQISRSYYCYYYYCCWNKQLPKAERVYDIKSTLLFQENPFWKESPVPEEVSALYPGLFSCNWSCSSNKRIIKRPGRRILFTCFMISALLIVVFPAGRNLYHLKSIKTAWCWRVNPQDCWGTWCVGAFWGCSFGFPLSPPCSCTQGHRWAVSQIHACYGSRALSAL